MEYSDEEFIQFITGHEIVKTRLGEDGFDIVFDNGLVLETYDGCKLAQNLIDTISRGKETIDCEKLDPNFHKELLNRLIGRTVVKAEIGWKDCIFRFHLDNGDVVCILKAYAYAIGKEE